jgi:hypothetical protein
MSAKPLTPAAARSATASTTRVRTAADCGADRLTGGRDRLPPASMYGVNSVMVVELNEIFDRLRSAAQDSVL